MKAFKIIGSFLLLAGIVFFIFQLLVLKNNTTVIKLPGNVKGFSDIRIASEKEVKEIFAKAESAMNHTVTSYKKWNNISIFASWVAFFLSGIITLLAGYLGFFKTDNVNLESLQTSIQGKARLSKIIGLLAASATLMTGFSVKAKEQADTKRTKGVEIRDLIIASYKDVQQAKPNEVTLILEKLKLQSSF